MEAIAAQPHASTPLTLAASLDTPHLMQDTVPVKPMQLEAGIRTIVIGITIHALASGQMNLVCSVLMQDTVAVIPMHLDSRIMTIVIGITIITLVSGQMKLVRSACNGFRRQKPKRLTRLKQGGLALPMEVKRKQNKKSPTMTIQTH